MYNVSSGYKTAIKQPSRIISAKVVINNNTYLNDKIVSLSFEDTSNPSTKFELGAVSAAKVDLSLIGVNEVFETATFKPYIGLDVDGAIEYIPLGTFYADKVERKKDVVKLDLYDGMLKLEQAYFTSLRFPAAITAIVNEICTKTGFQLVGTLPNYSIAKPEGYTYREVVGLIAALCGGFAKFNRDGKLTIKSYAAVSESITSDNYIDYRKKKDRPYRIDKITVQAGENVLTKGTLRAGGSEITFENPFMTDTILTDVFNKLNGFEYLPAWFKAQGNPALECGDIVTLTTADNEIIKVPVMKQKLSYQGGLTMEIDSEGESENSNQFSSGGSMTRKVERVVYEQALILEALINKATIDDLQATVARIDTLYVKTATIETLLAGNIGAVNLAAGAITAGSGIIAKGAIGDAEISNLSAAKINTGTLDTSKATIAGPNGRMTIKGNKLQIFDQKNTTLYERIMLGIDDANNSALTLRGADGTTVLLTQDGLTKQGFTDGYGKVDNDSLDPAKIDIQKVVTRINNGTTTIQSSKIYMDNKTLDVSFKTISDTVTAQGQTISSHTSQLSIMDEAIKSKVSSQLFEDYVNGFIIELSFTQDDVYDLKTRLETAETTIDQTATAISLKANKSEVYTTSQVDGLMNVVTTRIATAEGKIDVQAGQITQRVTKTEFESTAWAYRNLVPKSDKFLAGSAAGGITPSITSQGYLQVVSTAGNLNWHTGWMWDGSGVEEAFNEGDDFVIAFEMRSTGHTSLPTIYLKAGMGYYPMNGKMSTNFSIVWCTAKWIKAGVFQPYLGWSGVVGTTIIKNVFIAKGTRPPTSWVAAPEDTDVRLTTAEATIVNQGNAITQKVSQTDYNGNTIASMINQTATTIKIQASKINLVGAVTVLSDITGKLGSITAGNISGVTISGSRFTTTQQGGTSGDTYELDLYASNLTSKATYTGTIFGTVEDQLDIIQGQLWISQYTKGVKRSHLIVNSNSLAYFDGASFVEMNRIQFGNNFIDLSSATDLYTKRIQADGNIMFDVTSTQKQVRATLGPDGDAGFYMSNTNQGRVGLHDWGMSRSIWVYERSLNQVFFTAEAKFNGDIFVETWRLPGLGASWTQYGGSYPYAGYLRQPDGLVIFRGAIKGGTFGNTIFTLPASHRPQYDMAFMGVDNNNNSVVIIVRASGAVVVQQGIGYTVNNAFVSLDGVRFQTKVG